jgi:hypothetical protein
MRRLDDVLEATRPSGLAEYQACKREQPIEQQFSESQAISRLVEQFLRY